VTVDPATPFAYALPMTHAQDDTGPSQPGQLHAAEFIPLMAAMQALTAMSIDAMLPSLGQIGRDLNVANPNDVQFVITAIFAGMIIGGLVGGPMSDSSGRKAAIYCGLGSYILGSLIALTAVSFPMLLAGRLLQGFGASIPSVVSIALLRDLYVGRAMARVMSFSMSVFILVPIVAPIIGQAVLLMGGWRLIFAMFVAIAALVTLWFGIRQPETLAREKRVPFEAGRLLAATREVLTNRSAMGFSIASGILFGAFLGYLSSSQQIFQETYALGRAFPFYFASLAAAIGLAMFLNGTLVMRLGMRKLTNFALTAIAGLAIICLPLVLATAGKPPLWALMIYLWCTFLCVGFLFGNLNAMSIQSLGHIAGVAAALINSLRFAVGMPLGVLIGRAYDGTVSPLVAGFAVLASIALVITKWAERREAALGPARP